MDELRLANWQRTKDGAKNRNRPKPVSPLARRGRRIGRTTRPAGEVAAMLRRYGPRQEVTDGQ